MIRAVVFDLGQVLASGDGVVSEPARLLGVDEDAFAELYWRDRAAYDEGASDAEYWGPILTGLGKPAAIETIQQLTRLDADLWLQVRPQARTLLADVRAAGVSVTILTNAPFNLDVGLLDSDLRDEADAFFVSASMGFAKPHRVVYERVSEVLDVEPHQIAFIDDRERNVAGAERAGWAAHLWVSDDDTRAWLTEIGVLS